MNSPNNNILFFLFKEKKIYCLLYSVLFFSSIFAQEIDPNGYNVFKHENGRAASEGYFSNGLPEGIWKNYYEDGTLKSIGKKKAGLSDSTWVFFDNEGRKVQSFQYANDLKNGCAKYFDTLENVVKEMLYIDNIAQGEIVEYYASGELKSVVNVSDGKRRGDLFEYNESGDVITEEIYDNGYLKSRNEFNRYDQEGRKTGTWRTYHRNGTIESEVSFKEGKKNGYVKVYNEKGKLIDFSRMEGDTLAGNTGEIVIIELYKEYYPSGKLRLLGGDNNGKKNGVFREYDEEGEIINGFLYKDDTLVAEGYISTDGIYAGEWNYFYTTGKVKAKGAYLDGKKDGKWIYYYPNGKKEQEGKFTENELRGKWIWFYSNGQVKREEFYNRKSLLEGTVFEYDSLGNELTRGDYFNGIREGEWFYHVGDHKETGAYTLGLRDGIWKYYYHSGRIAYEGLYDEGEAKGKHVYYHKNGIVKKEGKYLGGERHGRWKTYDTFGEKTQVIEYRRGEIYKIDGFKVYPATSEE